jgi:Fe-S-cluster formation regulator IscX/YfhJ
MSDQVADVLDDAADLIERGGWIQNALYDHAGGFCSVGALYEICPTDFPRWRTYAALRSVIGGRSLAEWNNDPSRTKQQVLDAFRAAAKQERMHLESSRLLPGPPSGGRRDEELAGGDAETRTRPADESHPPR